MDKLIDIKDDKIRILQCNYGHDRKILHSYFDKYLPKIGKGSLRCDYFPEGDKGLHFITFY